MNSRPQLRSRLTGFTLVELLTVIAIIAILMGLLFPAMGIVKEQARKAEAKTACTAIVTAVKAYNTEYGKYPNPNSSPTDALFGGKPSTTNGELFNILRALDVTPNSKHIFNPRRILFFEGKAASNKETPKGGFADNGTFYDPWGTPYGIVIDFDYDNTVDKLPYTDFTGTGKSPQTGCAVFSLGKDGIVGSASSPGAYKTGSNTSDDVVSWQ